MKRMIHVFYLFALLGFVVGTGPSVHAQSFPTQYDAFTLLDDLDWSSTAATRMNRINRIDLGGTFIYPSNDASATMRVFAIGSGSTTPVMLNTQIRSSVPEYGKALGLGFIMGAYTYPYNAPFATNGTPAGTQQLLSYSTKQGYMSALSVSEVNGIAYMSTRVTKSTNSSTAYLYKTNGTAAGTVQLKSWSTNTYSIGVEHMRAVGNLCVFVAWTGNSSGVYKSNGTAKGTVLLKSVGLTGMDNAVVCGGYYIFAGTDTYGTELWRSNGTASGTVRVSDINPSAGSSSPKFLTILDNKVYFAANTGSGNALYRYDPAANTVAAVSMGAASDPQWLTVMDGKLYYSAVSSAEGRELWGYDPSTNQADLVADIYSGATGSDPHYSEYTTEPMFDNQKPCFEVLSGSMYFAAKSEASGNYMLWRSDGTASGTEPVTGFTTTGATFPSCFTAVNGKLFFLARNAHGNCLFVYDPNWTPPSPKSMASALPKEVALGQNYPNPFNPSTMITFTLPEPTAVRLAVFDVLGREVSRLVDDQSYGSGEHQVRFDASTHPSGLYYYRLEAGGSTLTRRMLLLR